MLLGLLRGIVEVVGVVFIKVLRPPARIGSLLIDEGKGVGATDGEVWRGVGGGCVCDVVTVAYPLGWSAG